MELDFQQILRRHSARYPAMRAQDYGKLAYQNALGPAHLALEPAAALERLQAEWEALPPSAETQPPEPIGNGLCRFHLYPQPPAAAPALLADLFCRTAQTRRGTAADLEDRLAQLEKLAAPDMADWLAAYRSQGCPPVGHSPEFRAAYQPHYRLLLWEYGCYFPALLAIASLLETGKQALVAIDGCCGSGKTGLAEVVAQCFPCRVFHMDAYFLPMPQRKPDWETQIGGNMDFPRFLQEVLLPAKAGETVHCRPFDCQSGILGPVCMSPPQPLTVVEGSYSQHPLLTEAYDLRLLLTCDANTQARRLKAREGDYFAVFQQRWIPMEQRYFRDCAVERGSDLVLDTSEFF